jgi:hypothetical protein
MVRLSRTIFGFFTLAGLTAAGFAAGLALTVGAAIVFVFATGLAAGFATTLGVTFAMGFADTLGATAFGVALTGTFLTVTAAWVAGAVV